jgi:hypothetical protein
MMNIIVAFRNSENAPENQSVNAVYGSNRFVCFEIHTKHTNTMCGQNVEFVNVKQGGTYSNHWALKR